MTKDTILQEAQLLKDTIIDHRRWLHAHAETGFALSRTKAYVRSKLENMGYSV